MQNGKIGRMERPSVIVWYKIYCACMALGYILFSAYIAFLIWFPKEEIVSEGEAVGKALFVLEYLWSGLLVGTIMVSMLYIAAIFLPRRPWAWVYGIFAICIGLPICCLMPLSIPVLVLWFRPETKDHFGWEQAKAASA